jgi:hypothetical protein
MLYVAIGKQTAYVEPSHPFKAFNVLLRAHSLDYHICVEAEILYLPAMLRSRKPVLLMRLVVFLLSLRIFLTVMGKDRPKRLPTRALEFYVSIQNLPLWVLRPVNLSFTRLERNTRRTQFYHYFTRMGKRVRSS